MTPDRQAAAFFAALEAGRPSEEAAAAFFAAGGDGGQVEARITDPRAKLEEEARELARFIVNAGEDFDTAGQRARLEEIARGLAAEADKAAEAGKAAAYWKSRGDLQRYEEEPKPPRWIIDRTFKRKTAVILAADGAVGKTWLALDLALTVAERRSPTTLPGELPRILGHKVPLEAGGAAVVLTKEDDEEEIHGRMKALDPTGERRRAAAGRLFIFEGPDIPDFADPAPIGYEDRDKAAGAERFKLGEAFDRFAAWLLTFKPVLVVLDPLSALTQLDVNDNAASAFLLSKLNKLAADLDALILVTHHLNKAHKVSRRDAVRGASALVNGARAVFVVEPADPGSTGSGKPDDPFEPRDIADFLEIVDNAGDGTGWSPLIGDGQAVIVGELVKSNALADTSERFFARGTDLRFHDVTGPWRAWTGSLTVQKKKGRETKPPKRAPHGGKATAGGKGGGAEPVRGF